MSDPEQQREIHELDATVRVGKHGVESVVDELDNQLDHSDLVKVKFLRSARGGTTSEELADDLAERTGADLVQTRGHTGVYQR